MPAHEEIKLPLIPGEAWSDAAIADVNTLDPTLQSAWSELIELCLRATGSAPSAKWTRSVDSLLAQIGAAAFRQAVCKWFPLVDLPRTQPVTDPHHYGPDPNLVLQDVNADILKGLVWLCARTEDKEVARALTALALSAYRKLPGVGPRCVRVGNACVWALGNMPGREGLAQLALLKVKVKFGSAQKVIETALRGAAARANLPREEIEELIVPTYGLTEIGRRREQFGDFTAELTVTGTHDVELRWSRPDGKPQASAPKAVKEQHAAELKELTQAAKDIQKMLPAQRDRIDGLYLEQKSWALPTWRERYLDHPLLGTVTRRLIWKFSQPDRAVSGIWHAGQIVGRDGRPLDWLDDTTRVELWHPINMAAEAVLEWRQWLAAHEIQQPFKQAHREIYLLTDAEQQTQVYSNRFAAHIIKQHQFNALCGARGWKNRLRLMVDDTFPAASRSLPVWGLRAEFWVEGIGTNYGTDTNETGVFLYLVTDQVRFYSIAAPEHTAHASGGGYTARARPDEAALAPLSLDQIPPLVFSEIMRDVDLFVGVASVGNDPNWTDGGRQERYQVYWQSYSFGDLSETARTRRQVLELLVPRLKIADRCRFTDKFLVVRGNLRTYKIHLGSSNILMAPNDQYLCIVPSRSVEGMPGKDKVMLPFEGDSVLAVILSKAFLLAADDQIKDQTIVRQIAR
ncbi:MAG: DUF4132 domain-containing protein [Anaerolineae bacterium]